MALFDWTPEEKWRHIKHFIDTHTYSESNLAYLKSWVDYMILPNNQSEGVPIPCMPTHTKQSKTMYWVCPDCDNTKKTKS